MSVHAYVSKLIEGEADCTPLQLTVGMARQLLNEHQGVLSMLVEERQRRERAFDSAGRIHAVSLELLDASAPVLRGFADLADWQAAATAHEHAAALLRPEGAPR